MSLDSQTNKQLTVMWRVWRWEGDWMVCKSCHRALIASRDGEILPHAECCKTPHEQHPWRRMREILSGNKEA